MGSKRVMVIIQRDWCPGRDAYVGLYDVGTRSQQLRTYLIRGATVAKSIFTVPHCHLWHRCATLLQTLRYDVREHNYDHQRAMIQRLCTIVFLSRKVFFIHIRVVLRHG
jgi:hypothetical protein